jgi:hypothetical protein
MGPLSAMQQRITHHILPTSATMVGVCITVISIVKLTEISRHFSSVIDDIMAFDSLAFTVSAFLSYLSMKISPFSDVLERYADWLFMMGLLLMVVASFALAMELGHF